MKKLLLILLPILLVGCSPKEEPVDPIKPVPTYDYGVFLGADINTSTLGRISTFKKAMVELDDYSETQINYLKDNGVELYAYLSIGSLETYRDYYEEFKDYTFMDYDNWPDERWIDVSQSSWQDHIISEANRFKDLGATGLFMDNFDVYYIAMEEYECSKAFKTGIYNGCISILNRLSETGLKLVMNSGSTLLEELHDKRSNLLSKIDCYTQECVYSSILDYDNDIFGRQDSEETDYYLSVVNFMKNYSDILCLEYTKDTSLIEEIKSNCERNNFYYYISNSVSLK